MTPPIESPLVEPELLTEADVLLVTVTPIETQAVLDTMGGDNRRSVRRHFIGPNTYYDLGMIGGVRTVLVRVTTMGSVGRGAALQTITNGIQRLHPSYIVMVGIAFGVRQPWRQVGDVLVAQQMHFYENARIQGRWQIIERGNTVPPSTLLLNRLKAIALEWTGAKVHFGLLLSGEKLIDSESFLKKLLKRKPEAIGGEMEGAGLYAAAEEAKIDWILVKGISDWADGNKEQNREEYQHRAAYNAAKFILYALEQGALAPTS